MSFRPAGFEESSDEDFDFNDYKSNPAPKPTSNSHQNSTSAPKCSFMPAGAESSEESYDDDEHFGPFASGESPPNAQNRVRMPVIREPLVGVGRGRGMLDRRGRGRGGFGSPSSAQGGRGNKRNQFPKSSKGKSSSPQKPAGPSPVALEDFKVAIEKGNLDGVQKYLDDGISVNILFSSGWTPLMHAANSSKLEIIELLLKNGANVNFQKDMYTVLMAACDATTIDAESDVLQAVNLLLDHGARIGVYDRHRMTPLMYAARQGRVSICLKLLEKGAQIDKTDVRGWTALAWAASEGHGRLVRVLLDHKADSKLYTNDGQAPSDIAYSKGYETISNLLESAATGQLGQRIPTTNSNLISTFSEETQSSHAVSSFDELELFISGLELGHLVPKFKEHKISFTDLLMMTEAELEQMGVTQVGVRKKILDAVREVHSKEWGMASMQQQNKNLMSCPEVTNVLANIHKHLSVIHSSVGYVQKHIEPISDATQFVHDVSEAEGLVLYAKDAAITAESLLQDLTALRTRANQLASQANLISADLISPPKESDSKNSQATSFRGPLLLLGLAGIGIGLVCYKKYSS